MSDEIFRYVERLYPLAKAGKWDVLWASVAGETMIAAACSRYAKRSSAWTFLHQAAYSGHVASARALIRLGASPTKDSNEGQKPADVADTRGHKSLGDLLRAASTTADSAWSPPTELDLLPSSKAWDEATERRAWREMRVGYGGGCVVIPRNSRFFVDSFGRILIGWHGTHDPPGGMNGESMVRHAE